MNLDRARSAFPGGRVAHAGDVGDDLPIALHEAEALVADTGRADHLAPALNSRILHL